MKQVEAHLWRLLSLGVFPAVWMFVVGMLFAAYVALAVGPSMASVLLLGYYGGSLWRWLVEELGIVVINVLEARADRRLLP